MYTVSSTDIAKDNTIQTVKVKAIVTIVTYLTQFDVPEFSIAIDPQSIEPLQLYILIRMFIAASLVSTKWKPYSDLAISNLASMTITVNRKPFEVFSTINEIDSKEQLRHFKDYLKTVERIRKIRIETTSATHVPLMLKNPCLDWLQESRCEVNCPFLHLAKSYATQERRLEETKVEQETVKQSKQSDLEPQLSSSFKPTQPILPDVRRETRGLSTLAESLYARPDSTYNYEYPSYF